MKEVSLKNSLSLIFIFSGALLCISMFIPRDQPLTLGLTYFSAFFSYFWMVYRPAEHKYLISVGIAVRLIMFCGLPSLSDDIYRFIWDANLISEGINPYELTPADLLQTGYQGANNAIYEQLNSPNYFSIYPPLNQLVFWIAATIGEQNLLATTNIIRSILLLADVGTLLILRKLLHDRNLNPQLVYWYFLNPLVILEITGNIHFEGLVIFFLVLALWLLDKNQSRAAAMSLGIAAGTKLLPFIFLPAVLFKNSWGKGIVLCLISCLTAAITLAPVFIFKSWNQLSTSLDLYFQHFEFNASVYYIIREFGICLLGYNPIQTVGPLLSIISAIGILGISLYGWRRSWALSKTWTFVLLCYLSFGTTIHPWYTLPLIPIGIVSGYYFPVLWSLLVFVSYFGYATETYELSSGWLVLEYIGLWTFIAFETYLKKYRIRLD